MTPEQRIYAVMFNSIGPALKTAELWAPLFARQRIAESISEALAAQGYAIAPATPPRALEASQRFELSPDGMTGPLAYTDSSTGLSEPQPWAANATVLVDGQEIPIDAHLTVEPSTWSVAAHLDPDAGLYLPLGSCVIRLPDGREGAAVVTSVQNGVCGSLSGFGPPPTAKPLLNARAEEAEEALHDRETALARIVQHALRLAESRPVEADALAAVILNLDPADLRPGAALTALTEGNHRDA